jgi:nucleoside-diphosphate-sugar epimerase
MAEPVLVTGATGFVGRHLVSALAAVGHPVYTHSSAVTDIGQKLPVYDKVKHVFHLAGRTFVPESWSETASYYAVNVQGTVNVMETCREHNASVTIVSSYVYGVPQRLPIDEHHPVAAENPYAHTKILAEEVARFYGQQFGLHVSIIRPFNLYGHGQDRRFLIPHLIHAAVDPEVSLIEVADLKPLRDYLHVRDFVRLLMLVMQAEACGTYNAGSGASISVHDLAGIIRDQSGTGKRIMARDEHRRNEIPNVVADISCALGAFGWEPKISLIEGLSELVNEQKTRLGLR